MVSGSHARRSHALSRVVAPLVLLLVVALALLVVYRARGDDAGAAGPGGGDCDSEVVETVVSPRLEPAVRPFLDEMSGDCLEFKVTAETQRQTLDAMFFGRDEPDLWMPDGAWGLDKVEMDAVSPAVASSPVVLIGGPRAEPTPSWAEALADGVVALPDPLTDSVGTLAVTAPRQEDQERSAEDSRALLVPLAQSYGEQAAAGEKVDVGLDNLTASSTRVVATTEADLLASGSTADALRSVTPSTGAPLLTFPLALSKSASPNLREAGQAIAAWFDTEEGRTALHDNGLRDGAGGPIAAGTGAGELTFLPQPASADVDDYRLTWQVLSVPSSALAVFDVSASMDETTESGETRINVAAGAAKVALEAFPDHARVGLWVFSVDQGGPGQDYRVLDPVKRLDAEVGGVTQRERVAASAATLPGLTTGGTGLHDTALAAYRQALKDYDDRYSNAVVLLTDGANDDPGSIDEAELLKSLKGLVDPDKPVRIIGVAVTADADLPALTRIAEATGGNAYRADTPEDILEVISTEVASR